MPENTHTIIPFLAVGSPSPPPLQPAIDADQPHSCEGFKHFQTMFIAWCVAAGGGREFGLQDAPCLAQGQTPLPFRAPAAANALTA